MIFRVFKNRKRSIKSIIITVFFCIFIWVMFLYIIYNFLFGLQTRYEHIGIYKHVNFDFILYDVSVEYFNTYEENRYAACLKIPLLLSTSAYTEDNRAFGLPIMVIDTASLNTFLKFFPNKNFVNVDDELLIQKNAILLTQEVAANYGLSVGDNIKINDKQYTIAGIFNRGIDKMVKSGAVMLWDSYKDMHKSESNKTDAPDTYTQVFVISKDYKSDMKHLNDTAFKHGMFLNDIAKSVVKFQEYVNENGSEWVLRAITDILNGIPVINIESLDEYRQGAYTTKNRMYAMAVDEYKKEYNITDDTFYSALCLAAMFAVCILESYRHAKQNQIKVGILRTLGFRQIYVFIYYFMRSFIKQTIIMVCAVAFPVLFTSYSERISAALVTEWISGFAAVIAVAAALSALVSMKQLQDKTLLIKLNEER